MFATVITALKTFFSACLSGGNALILTGVLAFASGAWVAWGWMDNRMEAALAKSEAEASARYITALEHVRAVEQDGHVAAAKQLAAEQTALNLKQERDDALRKLTTGKPCLAAAAVRLLNSAADPARLSAAAAGTADADTAFASDTDLALWANNARLQHDACRGRIDALRELYEAPTN
ncbi:MAG: hypothetical protein LBQ81_07305 [Zoogloeaceae bacterium]|jgi:hypothetical protein|nr:hypothetical protein [Zoogloeaceae bacterium]